MSDSGEQQHCQPPSALVFSPEAILSPSVSQNSQQGSVSNGANTVSMPFVRCHVTQRLKAAKAQCKKKFDILNICLNESQLSLQQATTEYAMGKSFVYIHVIRSHLFFT
ncbi:MAG: hypothetical protein NXY57DRAFT_1040251 [Lentinula lateritia]|nr:MAG: hypothetical protein NXY57DRAFT_1040251 [Lentinula lateritia]